MNGAKSERETAQGMAEAYALTIAEEVGNVERAAAGAFGELDALDALEFDADELEDLGGVVVAWINANALDVVRLVNGAGEVVGLEVLRTAGGPHCEVRVDFDYPRVTVRAWVSGYEELAYAYAPMFVGELGDLYSDAVGGVA